MAKFIKMSVDTGYVGAEHEQIIKVNDDVTDEQLDEMLQDYIGEWIVAEWYELDTGDIDEEYDDIADYT